MNGAAPVTRTLLIGVANVDPSWSTGFGTTAPISSSASAAPRCFIHCIASDAARTALDDADDEFTTGDIDHVLELLYNRGEIYPVNDRFRFTDPAEFDRRYHDDDDEA